MMETIKSTKVLVKEGLVMVYCTDDPILKKLEDCGASAIMPLALIGPVQVPKQYKYIYNY